MEIDTALGHEGDTALWVGRGVLREVLELVVFVLVVADVTVTVCVRCEQTMCASYLHAYPLPARYKHCVPSSQKGMQTPEMESRIWKPPMGSAGLRGSHRPS